MRTVLGGLVLFAAASVAQGEPLSVKEFQDKLQAWRAEGKSPPPLPFEVEGRVSLYSKDRLRLFGLKDPPVLFLSKTDLPELTRKWATVTGKIRVDPRSGEYTFDISSARESPSDIERYHDKRRKLRTAPAADWYELGRWAEIRGEFYKDDEMLARSAEAYRHGIDIEHKQTAKDDPDRLFELAEKAKSYRLPQSAAQELTHEACHLLVRRQIDKPGAALEELAKQLAEKLPGAREPQRFIPDDLAKHYQLQPVTTYAGADSATRLILQRLLYITVLMRMITPELSADGSNGFEVADKIHKLVPEYDPVAEEYRDKALCALAAEAERLT
jgi:hypothetical protein